MFVPDADAEVEGAPGSPLDVRCLDANKDYIIVTWKQPAVDRGNSILGYFVDRSVSPAKILKFVWFWRNKLRRWTCFFTLTQMWGWNQPLDSVQWHSGEVCPVSRYGLGGGSLLHFPCSCGQQQRHEPTVQSVWASGCHGSGWPRTNERCCFIYCLVNSRRFFP